MDNVILKKILDKISIVIVCVNVLILVISMLDGCTFDSKMIIGMFVGVHSVIEILLFFNCFNCFNVNSGDGIGMCSHGRGFIYLLLCVMSALKYSTDLKCFEILGVSICFLFSSLSVFFGYMTGSRPRRRKKSDEDVLTHSNVMEALKIINDGK